MRTAKLHLARAMPVLALAVTLYLLGRVVDVLLMILVGAVLVGLYLLRRYARAELLYQRLADGRREHPAHNLPVNRKGTPDRRDVILAGARVCVSRPRPTWRVPAHGGRLPGRQDCARDWRSVMPQLQVRDVMTPEVITVRDDASASRDRRG